MEPPVRDEVPHGGVLGDHGINAVAGGVEVDRQPQRLVHPARTVTQGLARQAYPKVAAVPLEHPDTAADDVVEDLVAAAESSWIDGR
jgi:hypothetical protein